MKKIIGYILALLGLLGVAIYTVPEVSRQIPLPAQIAGQTLIIISLVLILIGVFFIVKSGGGRKAMEIPIYHGKNIVGYRRH